MSKDEFEEQDDYEPEETQTELDIATGSLNVPERIPFSREDLINAHALRNSDTKSKLIDIITQMNIFAETKRILYTLIFDFYSQDAIMANLEGNRKTQASTSSKNDILGVRLALEKRILYARAAMTKTEANKPEMIALLKSLYDHHANFIVTRATGVDRESLLNRRYVMRQESINVQRDDTERLLLREKGNKRESIYGRKR